MSIFSRFLGSDPGGGARGDDPAARRERMVEAQIRRRGVRDERVLEAMREVPRHLFVPPGHEGAAYADQALPIGHRQTISQPYIVAYMTEILRPEPGLRVLEVGTGSAYQAAVLAAVGMEVFSLERIPELHHRARENLARAGYLDRVRLRLGDGYTGWPEEAPFDRILVTAAAEEVPPPLFEQLAPGGVLVAPVGDPGLQMISRYTKGEDGTLEKEALEGARFVPLVRDTAEGTEGDEGAR